MQTDQTLTQNPPQPVGVRYDRAAGLEFLQTTALGELMALAHAARKQRIPGNQVSFVFDTNPNYTNICETQCKFCAFCRTTADQDAYTLSPDQVAEKVSNAVKCGATTVLLQGGHNPVIGLKQWIDYIQTIQKACPKVHIHPFSPAEYVYMAQKENITVRQLLEIIYEHGIRTIPGGGAEILTDRVRQVIAPQKASSEKWLEVCETAHQVGFKTTATMMFGHVETDEEIIDHFLALRALQDRTGGFTSFIPWSFKPGNTPLSKTVPASVHPIKYVRIIAVARLLLDNFPHIQSSWFSENISAGQLGLLAGADDFGGILVEENVLKDAGHQRSTTLEHVLTIIKRTGFVPVRRDSHYNIIEEYTNPI